MTLEIILICTGFLLVGYVLWSHYRSRAALRFGRRIRPLQRYPSITVIRPIRGLDAGARENINAALDNGYPGQVETLFIFDDRNEPAVPLAEEAIKEHERQKAPGSARILLCGPPPAGQTGKLNAMIYGLKQAKGKLIAFADSDIRPHGTALRTLVETLLSDPKAGSAFAPVRVSEQPASVGDAGYALLLNGMYGPAAAISTCSNGGEMPFIMGQFMVFKRETIKAIGGLESAEGQLVDDMYLGARVTAAGYKNLVSPRTIPIVQEGLSTREFVATFIRWITFSRSGLPGLQFKITNWLQGTVFWLGIVATITGIVNGYLFAALCTAMAPLGVALSINFLHRDIGGKLPLKYWWVSFGLILSAPMIYFSIFTNRSVKWRGRVYQLGGDSRLAKGQALPANEQLQA
jgi:ceramide glucosyltransferase